jgi:hypothetical protein
LEDPGLEGIVILISDFRKLDMVAGTAYSWLRIGTDGGSETLGSIKCVDFLEMLENG